ncbi:MAG TPA: hypothetical protein PJ994_08145 [Tepidiformaceae bacterium]|nr:hypothetical protein [Tepidiformaceae bacterium]HMO95500.1 hypothetical protein [Tepidiformaceae bacterium]
MAELPLRVICAWCSTTLSEPPDASERTSHGVCVSCAEGFLKRLPIDYLQSIADPDGTVTLFSGHRFAVGKRPA